MIEIDTPCHVMGDIHAKIAGLRDFLHVHPGVSLILLGDCGFGFDPLLPRILDHLAEEADACLYCIRGNHDDPSFFTGEHDTGRLKLLPDYTPLTINGKCALCIGGGLSVDRIYRREGKNWWPSEILHADPQKLRSVTLPVDLLLSHTGPAPDGLPKLTEINPGLFKRDTRLLDDIRNEQENCRRIGQAVRPADWLFGHFHLSASWRDATTRYTVLDVGQTLDLGGLTPVD